ncbi:ATP-binding cassette domain-containing protein [Frankia sp. AgB1.9]|uniref:branched-chain amino acid ABC transporter permease/ATP-binding protein n=1 Tax=unclassified Frankia TaxID=2632575 RepID=UPI0027DE29B1|nr:MULTISPECIES: branched-chain amino acid ABC transporter permease/ATP-binding protein [unclassified Frankia]MBL7487541.1 ATP-binding cassette domain-containing protein [Frankia sp. AgW1.1]MBL7549512.1 ATP-binding cassette domain-containing protein [Frankia sp. AgB1.9]
MLPFIIAGLVTGAVYGLAGAGLVLTYKTSGVFNFAHGALATIAAYSFYFLHVQHGMPWSLAAALILVVLGPIGGVVFARFAKALTGASLALRVTATVSVLLVVQTGFQLLYGTQSRKIPPFLPTKVVTIFGTRVTTEKIIIFAVAVAATVALSVFFRYARLGIAMRAVVDDADLLDLAGTNPNRARQWAWAIGVVFAMTSGLLLASSVPLDQTTLTLLVVQAFGAAAMGSFTSLPVTFLGGLAIGLLGSLGTKYLTTGFLAQVPASLPFIVLFGVLLLFPKRWLQSRIPSAPDRRADWATPPALQVAMGVVLLAVLALAPTFAGFHLGDWTVTLTTVMLFLSLGLLVRTSGQVSLCHVAFTAIGAAAFSHLAVDHHWPWLLALAVTGLVAVPVGALLAIPATRHGGLYLALATLGFGIAVQQLFYTKGFMFGELNLGLSMPRPAVWGLDSDKGFYYVCLILTVLTAVGIIALDRGRLGRLLRGMADSSVALATHGVSVNTTRVLVFCLSAFIAAVSGALAGMAQITVAADNYQPLMSLTYLTLIVVTTGSEPWYALQAAVALTLVPSYITLGNIGEYITLLTSVTVIVYALTPASRRTAPPWLRDALDRLFRRGLPSGPGRGAVVPAQGDAAAAQVRPLSLAVEGLRVQFGGLVAVDNVDLVARTGTITGLIGPNGAGKTSTFNAISGLVHPTRGALQLDLADVTRRSPAARARRGLGRTFQVMELFDTMTVRQNVALGLEAGLAGGNPLRQILPRRSDGGRVRAAAAHALDLCDLVDLADRQVGTLSTGQRRLVELARCLAGDFRILLLDEPSSGLDRAETARFGEILRQAVRERRVGILLVEHDMALVSEVCDELYVLDFGKLLVSGPTAEVLSSDAVRAAYLGGDAEITQATASQPVREIQS